eukprot:TRINITY_DN10766_c0_g4_i4.p1 TRINITY_DN10766_c0_g4~~TRINITY_DN10766_c0_g4_i4.p1  ORF type:complete len:584 (+),score=136.26 TRINITY_DN10766_c0_g4_i4:64-1815(+)
MAETEAKRSKLEADLVVGGVPEHFNYPWFIAEERGLFAKHGVNVKWSEQKLGTGAMIKAAKSGELDMIIALTEGLVADIGKGSDLKLLGTYVGSPLCWAISTGKDSRINVPEDLRQGTFGVSRLGSGSHLMAYVLAIQRGWDTAAIKFAIKGNINQLCDGVNDLSSDAFLWETFTTKPYHDDGTVRRIGDITTPWPCFMLAAQQGVVDAKLRHIQSALAAVHEAALLFHQETQTMPAEIAQRYKLKLEDAQAWYQGVDIKADRYVSQAALEQAVEALKVCGQLPAEQEFDVSAMLEPRLAELRQDLKSMKLYDRSELVVALHKNLQAAGLSKGPLQYTDVLPYDQHHYYGINAVDQVVDKSNIVPSSRVINIGSGLGGPARYLAGKVGCQVLAVDIQEDLSRTAAELTQRTSLKDKVHHMTGDFSQVAQHLQRGGYDHIISWLTVLHFDQRQQLFRQCYELLRPGGVFFAADFVCLGLLQPNEKRILEQEVGCRSLADSIDEYKRELELAGFKIESCQDMSQDWKKYTAQRVAKLNAEADNISAIIGQDVFERLLRFYTTVANLYQGGRLGGVEVYARKPLGW